jgi:SH3-like domain-containing protein
MRRPVRVLLLSVTLLASGVQFGRAQPSTGTLQPPTTKPEREQPVKPPAAAPRAPVQKATPSTAVKPPAASAPRNQAQPQKPAAKPPASAVLAKPDPAPPPIPPTPPTAEETKPPSAEKLADPEKPEGTPPRLPRFASLRSDDVNMRAGPGTRYRIDWVYKRRDLPVEIEREFDVWRWVRDADGIQGWVHQATLMGRRSFIVQKTDATLRSDTRDSASAVAVLKPGVIGRIRSCQASSDWCDVQTGSYRGYLRREAFWGLLPGEAVNP